MNLTRFKLFFPERRDFFLEGSSFFYFGDRGDSIKSTERIFFFSRQIGLTEDGQRAVPVIGGVKFSGKVGRTSLGILNLTTEDFTYRDRQGEERFEPQANFSVLRLKRDICKYLRTGGFMAQTSTPGVEGDDWAGMADVVWESKVIFAKGSYADVGDNFNPEMGFFPRLGIREYRGNFSFIPKPKKFKLREIWMIEDYLRVTDQQGNLESEVNRTEIDYVWRNYIILATKYFDQGEVVKTPFEIHPGVWVQPGEYHFGNYFLGFQTVPGKPVLFFGRLLGGELYDGTFETRVAGFRLRPRQGLFSRIFYENTEVDLSGGSFTVQLLSVNVTYSVSPRLSARALVEWRSDDNLSSNLVVKWIYKPGAAFYVVYNGFRDERERPGRSFEPQDRSLVVKTTFYF